MDMYKEIILDHYKNPRNTEEIDKPDTEIKNSSSESCGDTINLSLKIKNNIITKIMQKTQGCALSRASMSLLSEYAKGKTLDEINNMTPEKLYQIIGFEPSISRTNCVLISIETLKSAIEKYRKGKKK